MSQLELPFDDPFLGENHTLWTPRDIWVRLNQRLLESLEEDSRLERKGARKIHFDDLATYYSTFANTPDGGLIVYGVEDKGHIIGCSKISQDQLNKMQSCHTELCPLATPEFKRIPVVVDGKPDFCVAIYVPYRGRLVETNKEEAWIRYGDSRHKMSEEEKRDFRSTRQELSFEQDFAPYEFPADFDLRIIQDFCDQFRTRESRADWTNEEVLVDRHLLRTRDKQLVPTNALVLLAARDPRVSIPGCRVRIQRFSGTREGVGDTYSPLRDRIIEGNLVKIIQEASEVISSEMYDVTWLNREGKFVTTPEYPRYAWFEALVNACLHRSYNFSGSDITVKFFADRMEIESPGGFVTGQPLQFLYLMASEMAQRDVAKPSIL